MAEPKKRRTDSPGPLHFPISKKAKKSIKKLPAKVLGIDPRLQRWFNGAHSASLQAWWDEHKIGVLTVSLREDGTYVLVDGMHRKDAGYQQDPMFMFDCVVWEGLTVEDEAEMFLALNKKRLGVRPYDLHRLGLLAGHWDDIAADQQIAKAGLQFGHAASSTRVGAVAACKRIVHLDKGKTDLLYDTLMLARHAWGDHADSWDGAVLQAIARVIYRNQVRVDIRRLNWVLRKRLVDQWKAEVRRARGGGGSQSRSTPIDRAIVEAYNLRLRNDDKKIR